MTDREEEHDYSDCGPSECPDCGSNVEEEDGRFYCRKESCFYNENPVY